RNVTWVAGRFPIPPRVQVKIRYKARPTMATLDDLGGGRLHVCLDEPVMGVTAGQGAVFYDGELCLGGGIIADN
ncbi:MAG: aminomethyltransferase beta-barrel domain-containing protein, partial [Chloroflexota bacterium]